MRIVHLTRQFHPARGGLETVVASLATRQAAIGHDVRVVTLNRVFGAGDELPAHDALGAVRIVRLPFIGSQRYPIVPGVLRQIAGADVVHVHAIDFFFDWLALTRFLHRRKLVASTHGGFFHTGFASTLKTVFFSTVTRLSIRSYGFVAASSEQDFKLFSRIRRLGMATVTNGVDTDKFAGLTRVGEVKQLIYFGRLAPNKRLDTLFPFLCALRRRDPDWRLVIAGRPMAVTLAELTVAAADHGLEDAVEILDEPSDEALREAIRASSIFVSPSQYEGFGIAAVEAMSAGLLPVLSDIEAHRDTVAATGLGVLTDFSEPQAAADATLAAFEDWKVARPAAADIAARLKMYSWDAVAMRFEAIYARVTGESERQILGARVQVTNFAETARRIDSCVLSREPLRLAFVNAHLANSLSANAELARALQDFHLVNDGVGLDLASLMLFGRSFPDNLNGTDFTPAYLDIAARPLRIFLLGSNARVVEKAAQHYAERWPRHRIVGFHHGFFTDAEGDALAARMREAKPDIVLAAMGNPRQELWLAKFIPEVAPVGLAVGALFNFQTGEIPRAPGLVRKLRLEWLFRLASEPGRLWRRYTLGNAMFLSRVALQVARGERA